MHDATPHTLGAYFHLLKRHIRIHTFQSMNKPDVSVNEVIWEQMFPDCVFPN